MLKKIANYPIHFVMGLVQVGIGLFLISSDHYFTWPPGFSAWMDNDIVGFSLMMLGLLFVFWVMEPSRSTRMEHIILVLSGGFMLLLAVYELIHTIRTGFSMPWISNAGLTAIIFILAAGSDSK
ncbi:hypothetical protein [Lacticaseibacillus paracasei]|nr:hypothetical protein [Lacticaseibacillus paracasei]